MEFLYEIYNMASANGFVDFKEKVPAELEKNLRKTSNTLFVPIRRKPWGDTCITRKMSKIS